MDSHLNIFNTYTKTNRTYQLENDLTRALAISFQEDSLFFHEILKNILKETDFYNKLFGYIENETTITISIQKEASKITDFDHIFAISLSESPISDFWEQNYNKDCDPICDLVIQINNIILVFEAKRDNVNCTAQLYNQILNITKEENGEREFNKENNGEKITPFDLNWSKLMAIALKVSSFEKTMNSQNRFLTDFISLVKGHNFRWLPQPSISALQPTNDSAILERIKSAISEVFETSGIKALNYSDRQGFEFEKEWANEILFEINDNGDLIAKIYPGNTKKQGQSLFKKNPEFNKELIILKDKYTLICNYHIKLSSFQKYFTGLWFSEKDLKESLYTKENFKNYTGRKDRGKQWDEIETLFDSKFNSDWDWKKKCDWNGKVINSRRNQFAISFGYALYIEIPFQKLNELDPEQSELEGLKNLLLEIYKKFANELLIQK